MRSAILAFVLGVWGLQQLPQLPDLSWAPILLVLLFPLWRWRASQQAAIRLWRRCCLVLLAVGAGFFWAAGVAHVRLADELPRNWEGQDVQVVGVVAALPQLQARGERFLFDVERVETPLAHIPHRISLTRYFAGFREQAPETAAHEFHAGERWRLTVRLKRPHSSYNPYGFDAEVWSLERDIRASGYLRKAPSNARLQALVRHPGYLVEHLRESVRDRLQAVLGDAPYAGVLAALVIGDEGAITPGDWQIFLRTGVNHLMSMCYLLKRKLS